MFRVNRLEYSYYSKADVCKSCVNHHVMDLLAHLIYSLLWLLEGERA